jgi:hypothetical protein
MYNTSEIYLSTRATTSAEVICMKLRNILVLFLVIFALIAMPISAKSENSQGNGPAGEGAPGQSDDGSRPGNGYGDENHEHDGPPGHDDDQVDWLPEI